MSMFEGKTAVITGAGRGIGRELALLLGSHGANVVVNDLGGGPTGGGGDASIAQQVADEVTQAGGKGVAETSSIASMAGGKALIECAMDNFGGVDILVNNAGIIRPSKITEMSEEDWDLVLAVNLKGYFATIRAAAEHLKKSGESSIVNIGSPSGFGHWGMANYCAAKEGVVGMTRAVARELGEYGVRANVVRPMATGTNLNVPAVFETIRYQLEELQIPFISNQYLLDHGVESDAAHVAAAIGWLASPLAANLNGRELYIVGGHIALVSEPELIRSQFRGEGWTFDALCDPMVTVALTYDQRNRYTRP